GNQDPNKLSSPIASTMERAGGGARRWATAAVMRHLRSWACLLAATRMRCRRRSGIVNYAVGAGLRDLPHRSYWSGLSLEFLAGTQPVSRPKLRPQVRCGRLALTVEAEPTHAPIDQPLELDDDVRVARRVTPQLVGPNPQFRQREAIGDGQRIVGISDTNEQPRGGVVDQSTASGVQLQRQERIARQPRAAPSGWM